MKARKKKDNVNEKWKEFSKERRNSLKRNWKK